jgi:hypothetical protein
VRSKIKFQFQKNLIAAVLFLVPLSVYLLVVLVPLFHVPPPVEHLFLTLTAVMGVHLLDRLVLFRETYDALSAITERIQVEVKNQTRSLAGTSASLQAMMASGVGHFYAGRGDAADDMRRDLTNPSNKSIRLIGISLNDFLRADERTLADTWSEIRRLIDEDRALDIRLLLIDPDCFGAQMRSRGEARAQESIVGRLSEDVKAVAESLLRLEKSIKGKGRQVRFECRFYRLAPILFLCQVDSASYVQQYYFWSHRTASRSSPVIRFRQTDRTSEGRLMHEGMRDHFDWIWEHASISIEHVLDAKSIGAEKGLHQSGIANIFASGGEGLNRIRWLLEHAKTTVWIQGVSLRSFFDPGPLFNAVKVLIERSDVDIRVLLIDKDSEQAKWRSYRERLFTSQSLTFESYLASGLHKQSDLFTDTARSVSNLRDQMKALRTKKGANWQPQFQVREYGTAPGCFMLRVDGTVLVEQYHYGKVVPDDQRDAPAILGKDMPLIEYQQSTSPLYDPIELRSPYSLLNDHFEFAFAKATEVNIWETLVDGIGPKGRLISASDSAAAV